MKYILNYWVINYHEQTGFEQGEILTQSDVNSLISKAEYDIMVVGEPREYLGQECRLVFVDKLGARFRQR